MSSYLFVIGCQSADGQSTRSPCMRQINCKISFGGGGGDLPRLKVCVPKPKLEQLYTPLPRMCLRQCDHSNVANENPSMYYSQCIYN